MDKTISENTTILYLPFATSATIGAAPDPVPPPIPAVTKTKSAPLTAVAISERLSSAACLPISGIPPAPRPRVTAFPIINLFYFKINTECNCRMIIICN